MPARLLLAASTDWPFPARLARAFAELGARAEAVCLKASPLRHSSALSGRHGFSPLRPLASLADAITKAAPELVIPCDDLMVELLWRLARARPQFASLMERSFGNPSASPILAARNAFLHDAAEAGAPATDNIALDSEADLERAAAQFGFPLVVKADASWGGDGVVIARDPIAAKAAWSRLAHPSRLKSALRAWYRHEPHRLVRALLPVAPRPGAQRFVAGHPATSAIACWQGELLAANHFDVVVCNNTGPATVVERSDCAAMADSAHRIVQRFGLSGLYGLDYMRDADGRVFLLEINPRATPTSHLALGPGHDLAAALLSAAGHPVPDRPAVTQKPRIALFPQELRRDPQSPHLATAYHDLPQGDPSLAAALGVRAAALTSFSQAFPGLSGLEQTPDPGRR